MIKKITLGPMSIEEFSRNLSVPASGKILTVSVKLKEPIKLSIVTALNEEVLSVKDDGVYYPRQNISSRKDTTNELVGEVQESDYFYFSDELLIELYADTNVGGKVVLDELVILYDDMEHL